MRARAALAAVLLAAAAAGAAEEKAALVQGLGSHSRKVDTRSPQAQQFFDQGLPGIVRYLIPFSGNAIVAAIEAKAVYFLNGTTQSYTPLNNDPLIPSATNIVTGVQWATNGQFYVATRPPTG